MAGHNGLVCAAFLARVGRRVIVVEVRDIVGGFATTESPFEAYPDVRSSMTSLDIVAGNIPPSPFDALGLEEHGLVYEEIDPFHGYVGPDRASLTFWRDLDRTCEDIARYSHRDAEAYIDQLNYPA